MTDNTIVTICWAVVAALGIQGATMYALVRLLTTGEGIFRRRADHESRIVGMNR